MNLPPKAKDLTGTRYGSLIAVEPVRLNKHGVIIWRWLCDCGLYCEGVGAQIKSVAKNADNPKVPSCGCIKKARAIETNTQHGYSRHPLNAIWQAMKQRCYNPNNAEYHQYGAKGVTVCPEWIDNLGAFVEWALNNGWKQGLHIDKDIVADANGVNKEYSPRTCQFVSGAINVGHSASRSNYKNNSNIKLKPDDVGEIRALYATNDYTQRELGRLFCVSQATIQRVLTT